VDSVPILLNPAYLILLNAGTLILTMLMMLIPAGILTRISPDKTIKFD
jgi:lipoprotein-releasing system permease protein